MPCFFPYLFTSRTSTTGAKVLHYLSKRCNSIMSRVWGFAKSFGKIHDFSKLCRNDIWVFCSRLECLNMPGSVSYTTTRPHEQAKKSWFGMWILGISSQTMVLSGLESWGERGGESALPKIFFYHYLYLLQSLWVDKHVQIIVLHWFQASWTSQKIRISPP